MRTARMIGMAALLLGLAAAAPQAAHAADGKAAFETNCASCHGTTGKGDGPVGAALDPKPRDLSIGEFKFDADGDGEAGTDADLRAVITKGANAFGGSPLMAPWAHLGDEQIDAIIAHIRSLKQ